MGFCNAVFPSGWSLPSPRCFIPPSTPPRPFRVGLSGPGCGAAGEVGEGGRNPNLGPLKLPRPRKPLPSAHLRSAPLLADVGDAGDRCLVLPASGESAS